MRSTGSRAPRKEVQGLHFNILAAIEKNMAQGVSLPIPCLIYIVAADYASQGRFDGLDLTSSAPNAARTRPRLEKSIFRPRARARFARLKSSNFLIRMPPSPSFYYVI